MAQGPSAVAPVLAGEGARLRAMAAATDTVTVWLDSDPHELGSLVTAAGQPGPSAWAVRILQDTVFESLVRYRPGESESRPGDYEPSLAQSWRLTADGREIVFELEPKVRFHDGRPMSTADVRSSIEAARRKSGRGEWPGTPLGDVLWVDVAGGHTVRVRLTRSNAYVLRALAEVPITQASRAKRVGSGKATGSEAGSETGSQSDLVGTGPYRVRAWKDGGVELERFSGYWGRAPAVANVVFRYEPDAAAALRLARSGEIDVIPALIREHHPTQARGAAAAGLAPLRLRPPTVRTLALNCRRPPFDDARVRCALARLLDRAALAGAEKGLVRPVGGPIWPGGPGDGPAMEPPPFDHAGASALLEQAGWHAGEGGLRARGSQRLLLTVLVSDRVDRERDLVLEQVRAAGFVLDIRVGTTAVLDNRLRDGKFDLAFVEWRALPGEDLTPVYGSGGVRNFGGFSDARVDEILGQLRLAWDPAARWNWLRLLGTRLAETCPVAPLVAPDPHGLINRRVQGGAVRGGWLSLREAQLVAPGP